MNEYAQANQEIIERWAAAGDHLDMVTPQLLRLDVLINVLFPEGSILRNVFDEVYARTLNERLVEVDKQRSQSKLLEGVRTEVPRNLRTDSQPRS